MAVTDIECAAPWWTSWEPVSVCLNGKQSFARKCEDYTANDYEVIFATRCAGNSTKDVDCDWIWSSWSEWLMCSTNCGLGDTTRTRTCNSTKKSDCESFTELRMETTECEIRACDINWSTWSEWSECSTECGSGEVTRSRTCTSKDNICPMNNLNYGIKNQPKFEEFETLDCLGTRNSSEWSDWTIWSECSEECGSGHKIRSKTQFSSLTCHMMKEEDRLKCFGICWTATIFVPVVSSALILSAFIFCCLKYKRKISKMCECIESEMKHGETVNIDYTGYTEYCRYQQNEPTIAEATANNQTNEEIDSNSGYEEYNERK